MEYIEYGDLAKYITQYKTKVDAKVITLQILEGLVVLHERSICHRDLKPQVRPNNPLHILFCTNNRAEYPRCLPLADLGQDHRFRDLQALDRDEPEDPMRHTRLPIPGAAWDPTPQIPCPRKHLHE